MRKSRIPIEGVPDTFWELAPDLAVEIVSPTETAVEIRERVRDFLSAGTACVWVVYPKTQEVIEFTPDGISRTFAREMKMTNPEILPGFEMEVAELFVDLGR